MAMPNELILVRHGHSEGNRANEQSRNGDESLFTPEYRTTPGHRWPLTPEGIEQARYLKWVRRIRPNAQSPVSAWKSVSRRTFSNSELLSSIDE